VDISSPFLVVSVIVAVFVVAILFATGTKEDGPSTD
jgi:VIT1/CCC1 family predicted Fe2+/Mn2+ transporter